MTNEQIISKMKDDMKMRGFSHWTEESYLGKIYAKYLKKLQFKKNYVTIAKYHKEKTVRRKK